MQCHVAQSNNNILCYFLRLWKNLTNFSKKIAKVYNIKLVSLDLL